MNRTVAAVSIILGALRARDAQFFSDQMRAIDGLPPKKTDLLTGNA